MQFEKKEKVTIPTYTYLDYYTLKAKYETTQKCPLCSSEMTFSVSDRILSSVCKKNSCKSNMRILEDTYMTYDQQAGQRKKDYQHSIDSILRAKFDMLFDYSKPEKVDHLRSQYLATKADYDALYTQWIKSDPNHPKLKEDRLVLIQEMKTKYSPEIGDQLNHVLNQLQAIEYTRVYNEIVPRPIYDLEIRVL